MEKKIMFFTALLFGVSLFLGCGQDNSKQKELDLKERELALEEKEFALDSAKNANLLSSNIPETNAKGIADSTARNKQNKVIKKMAEAGNVQTSNNNSKSYEKSTTISEQVDNYLGNWVSGSRRLTITKFGNSYKLTGCANCPFSAVLRDGILYVSAGMGELACPYDKTTDHILLDGKEYMRER